MQFSPDSKCHHLKIFALPTPFNFTVIKDYNLISVVDFSYMFNIINKWLLLHVLPQLIGGYNIEDNNSELNNNIHWNTHFQTQ